MLRRRLLLFCLSLVLITGFFLLPRNYEWVTTLFSYWSRFPDQKNDLSVESRMRRRFANNYIFSKNIADALKKRSSEDNVVLMPPSNYFKVNGLNYHVPEPAVFYYYTGIKTIWANSKDAVKADYYVRVSNGKIILDSVRDRKALQDTITRFIKLGVSL